MSQPDAIIFNYFALLFNSSSSHLLQYAMQRIVLHKERMPRGLKMYAVQHGISWVLGYFGILKVKKSPIMNHDPLVAPRILTKCHRTTVHLIRTPSSLLSGPIEWHRFRSHRQMDDGFFDFVAGKNTLVVQKITLGYLWAWQTTFHKRLIAPCSVLNGCWNISQYREKRAIDLIISQSSRCPMSRRTVDRRSRERPLGRWMPPRFCLWFRWFRWPLLFFV